MKNTDDDGPVFEFGDQDYGSAVGWQPWGPTEAEKEDAPPDMLYARPASEWLAGALETPPSPTLFGPFWRMDELAILFATTGVGKSVLALQIAEALARGLAIEPFAAPPRPERVLYLDFELDSTQFAMRYSRIDPGEMRYDTPYQFSPDLIRAELYWDGRILDGYTGFSDMFFQNISDKLDEHEATVLIVDNITFLDRTSTTNVNTALSIMRALSAIKRQKLVSILVLAHTSKRIRPKPLTEADLQGSINLANFADSIFAMGPSSRAPALRYLKQIKTRSGRMVHDRDHVPIFSLEKFDAARAFGIAQDTDRAPVENFLGMKFVKFDCEDEHISESPVRARKVAASVERKDRITVKAKDMLANGKSTREIAKKLQIPRTTIIRYLKERKSLKNEHLQEQ